MHTTLVKLSALLVACISAVAAGQDDPLDWRQLQRDPARSGRTSIHVGPDVQALWIWVDEDHVTRDFVSEPGAYIAYPETREIIVAGDVQPIVADGKVLFGATGGEFFALNASDGSTAWKQQLGGAVLHTAAAGDDVVVVGCMDHNIYGLNLADGEIRWRVTTGAGVQAAPLIVDGSAYVGSRDGQFYAIDLATGEVRWRYRTVAEGPESPFSGAPILQPAASDGRRVFFGAENMYFYCLDLDTGDELWRRPIIGQSFQYSWPVVVEDKVFVPVMVSHGNAEFVIEQQLDDLGPSTDPNDTWPGERAMIADWLEQNPHQRSMVVFDTATGEQPWQMPLGRVGGINYPPRSPVIYSDGRPVLYWRTRSATVLTGGTYGTKYTPDLSAVDLNTGDRVAFGPPRASGMGAELDNNFELTVGGDWIYFNNHMRGAHMVNPQTGQASRLTSILAIWDGGNFRGWGNQIIYLGNDADPRELPPPSTHRSPQGDSGIAIAEVDGSPKLFLNESGHYQITFGAIVCLEDE